MLDYQYPEVIASTYILLYVIMKEVKRMQINEFIQWLRTQKNPEKIEGMEKYMRNQFKFLGLQANERRQLAQPFLNEQVKMAREKAKEDTKQSVVDWDLLFTLWEQPEREFQLIGIDYLKRVQNFFILEDFKNLRKLVEWKSWWDTIDFLAKNIGHLALIEPDLEMEMLSWSQEESIWIRRIAILHQLAFKEKTNTDLLSRIILNNLHDNEFFIQKAIGWSLREYAKTDKNWVKSFVTYYQDELSSLSIREATKNLK